MVVVNSLRSHDQCMNVLLLKYVHSYVFKCDEACYMCIVLMSYYRFHVL